MSESRIYRRVQPYTHEEAEEAIRANDIDTLYHVAYSIAMLGSNWKYAQDLCVRLSNHPDKIVRGNAILGIEYVARFHGQLEKHVAKPVLLRALRDPEIEVVERAEEAIRVVNRYLHWRIGVRPKMPPRKTQERETPNL